MALTAQQIINKTIANEAAYLANDEGSPSYVGIRKKDNPNWKGWDLIAKKYPNIKTGDRFKNDTELETAVYEQYYTYYYKPSNCEKILSDVARFDYYDMYCNSPVLANRTARMAVNMTYGTNYPISDGMKSEIFNYLGKNDGKMSQLEENMLIARKTVYKCRCIEKPSLKANLEGWLIRCDKSHNWAKNNR
jgi:hypothetical protein